MSTSEEGPENTQEIKKTNNLKIERVFSRQKNNHSPSQNPKMTTQDLEEISLEGAHS